MEKETIVKVVFGGLAVGLLVLGVFNCISSYEKNECEMTWMWERITYLDVPLGKNIENEFPNYKLYVYGEGEYARQISGMKLKGIPVLFIPGNAGSHKQVRSLGSVSLRMSENPGVKVHFNYFVANLNEEFSGLYGSVLQAQTEFVHICVKKILSLYKSSRHPPSSVILVGHSMGGVLARALFTLPGFDPQTVHTIITQASPHQSPVATVDSAIDQFYQEVNRYWLENSNTTLSHLTAVSTGGGYRDFQVRSGLTSLSGIVPSSRSVSTTTMSVPLAWVSTDHQCSVWCRQMVLTTVRSLFDIVDKKTSLPSTDVEFRMRVFKHHFLHQNGTTPPKENIMKLDDKIPWELRTDRMWRLYEKKVSSSRYIAVPLVGVEMERETDSITIITNITNPNWICACRIPKGEEKCSDCLNLASRARLLPPRYSNRKFVRLSVGELEENTHIVLLVPGGSKQVEVIVDKYSMDTRHLVYDLPSVYDTIISFPISMTDGAALLQIRNSTVFYSLHLAGLSSPLTAYTARVKATRCPHSTKKGGHYEGSVMTLDVPWSNENTYKFFRYKEAGELPIKLQNPRQAPAPERYGLERSEAHLEMYLHPGCHYQLRLIMSPGDMLGQLVRYYATMFPIMFVAVLMLALGGQLTAFAKDGECLWMPDAVFTYSKAFYLAPVVIVLHMITSMKKVSQLLDSVGIPQDDVSELEPRHLWLQTLPTILSVLAWLATAMHCYMAHFAFAAISRALSFLFAWVPQGVLSLGNYLQLGLSILAFVASLLVCGTLGICIAYVLLLVKILRLYSLSRQASDGKVERSQYRFYFLLALLYMWLVVINAAPMVVWAKRFSESPYLSVDPSRWVGVVASVCGLCFVTSDSPLQERRYATQLRWTIFVMAVVSMPYCLIRLYRISFVIAMTLCLLAATRIPGLLSRATTTQHRKAE